MEDPAKVILIADIARDVLCQVAPEELPIFESASKAYFSDPAAVLKRFRSKDQILGFGVGEFGAFLTPIVLQALSETFYFLEDIAKQALKDGIKSELSQIVKTMLKKFHSSDQGKLPILTRDQMALIRVNVLAAATRLRVPSPKAELMADAVIAQLVLLEE